MDGNMASLKADTDDARELKADADDARELIDITASKLRNVACKQATKTANYTDNYNNKNKTH
jgi:hypothetical protein